MIPSVVVEATVGTAGAWANISQYVLKDGYSLSIQRGRSDGFGAAQPGSCSLTLANGTGLFTEDDPASAYAGLWKRLKTQIRVTVNGSVRFVGYLQSCPMTWPSFVMPIVSVTAVDAKAIMAASPTPATVSDLVFGTLDPAAWWPLNEPAGSLTARNAMGTGDITVNPDVPQNQAFGVAAPEGWLTGTQWACTDPLGGDLRGPVNLPSATSFTVLATVTPTVDSNVLLALSAYPAAPAIYIRADSSDPTRLAIVTNPSGTFHYGPTGYFAVGVPKLVGIIFTPTQIRILGTPTALTWANPTNLSDFITAYVGESPGTFSNVVILPYAMGVNDYARVRDLLIGGTLTQPVTTWLQMAIDAAGLSSTAVALGSDRITRAPDLAGQSPAAIGDTLAEAAGAMFVCNRATGVPTWIDHLYVGPVLDVAARMIRRDGVTWGSDPSQRVTDVQADGATLAAAGPSVWPRSGITLDHLLPSPNIVDHADWLVNTGEVMGGARLSGFMFDLARMDDPDDVTAVLSLDLRHRLRLGSGTPSQVPATLWAVTLEGYSELIAFPVGGGDPTWTITPNTAPDPRFIIEDTIAGVVEAGYRIGY